MPFNEGGYIWSNQAPEGPTSLVGHGVSLGVAAAVAGTALYRASRVNQSGEAPIDRVWRLARTGGNWVPPGSLWNTFRIAEFLSPFISPKAAGMTHLKDDVWSMAWGAESFSNEDTFTYLKAATGLDEATLNRRGIFRGGTVDPKSKASKIVFERSTKSTTGNLYSIVGDDKFLLARGMHLFEAGEDFATPLDRTRSVNRATKSIYQALDLFSDDNFTPEKVFRDSVSDVIEGESRRSRYIPIPGLAGQEDIPFDIARQTTLFRAVPAFGMERLNTLLSTTVDQFPLLGDLEKSFNNAFGVDLSIRSGTASSMFARFGVKALGIGAIGFGIAQADWVRRQAGVASHVGISAGVAGGIGLLATKLSGNSKLGLMAGVGSFFGQMVLPGFDQGIVHGAATTYTKANVLRAAVSPFSWYRRTLEGYLPGISSFEAGIGVGAALAALSYSPLPKYMLKKWGNSKFGLPDRINGREVKPAQSFHEIFTDRLLKDYGHHIDSKTHDWVKNAKTFQRHKQYRILSKLREKFGTDDALDKFNAAWEQAEEQYKTNNAKNVMNAALAEEEKKIAQRYATQGGIGRVREAAEVSWSRLKYSFFGADPGSKEFKNLVSGLNKNPKLGWLGTLFGTGFLLHGIATGGLLGSMQDASELQAIYEGRQLVDVRKNRWWECLHPETYLLVKEGTKQISEIQEGDEVLSHTGEYRAVQKVYKYPIDDKKMHSIRVWGSGLRLKGTENHSVFVKRKDQISEIWMRDILPGDDLIVPRTKAFPEKKDKITNLERFISAKRYICRGDLIAPAQLSRAGSIQPSKGWSIPRDQRLDFDLGYLFGFYLGDGNLMQGVSGIEIALQLHETEYAHKLSEIISLRFGVQTTTRIKKFKGSDSCIILRASSSLLGALFEGLFGREKQIPRWMFQPENTEFAQGLFLGFFHSDGNCHRKQWLITAKNLDHLVFIRELMLEAFGFWGSIIETGNAFRICYREDFAPSYGVEINADYVSLKVRSNDLIEAVSFVYDLNVEQDHTYTTVTGVVHNSGGTAFEGDSISYYRPHWYALMSNRVRQKGIWGEDEDSISPIGKFVRKNFTYQLEKEQYWDRPYPISSAAFADVPIIGKFLAGTIGNIIKPPKVMHASEWMRAGPDGEIQYAHVYKGDEREPAYSLGAQLPINPISPYDSRFVLSEAAYHFREMEGMTGWAKNVINKIVTGDEDLAPVNRPVLASASDMTSPIRQFWELNMGGALFTNEALRRFLPVPRSGVERYNPIVNSMPSWLPERFHYGDAYTSINWGEARLPGAGYAALHPELKGLDPEAYPLIHRYAILGDVAMHSQEFRSTRAALYSKRQAGETSERENQYMDYVDSLISERMNQFNFDHVDKNAWEAPGSDITQALWGGGKNFIRKAVAPFEYAAPAPFTMGFRPFQKLMHDRDPIEEYEYRRLYGTTMAFWDKPWRDSFRPAIYSLANFMGYQGKPAWRQEVDNVNAYFDQLEFIKYMNLAEQARAMGDHKSASRHEFMAASTRYGVNPQGNPASMYWSMPDEERKFFNAFANAQGADRKRILEMIPEDQVHMYQALWNRIDQGDYESLYPGQGPTIDKEYLAKQYMQALADTPMPREDWIGWRSDVEMDDVRVSYVNNLGRDIHDFGLWDSQLRIAERQPFVQAAARELPPPSLSTGELSSEMYRLATYDGSQANIFVSRYYGNNPLPPRLNYYDDRRQDIITGIRNGLGF